MLYIYNEYIYKPIFNLLMYFTILSNMDFGTAIILLTIFIKTLLLYPSIKATISQRKMQKIQPKLKKIQELYKDNKQKLTEETMKLWKEHNVNPTSGCMPLLIQLPILIALYTTVSATIESQKSFLYSSLSHIDLSQINYMFLGFINLLDHDTIFFPFLLGLSTYIQIVISTKNTIAISQEQQMMQKMMLYFMPIFVAIISMNFSIALSLYWFVSTLYTIIQTIVINHYIPNEQAYYQTEEINIKKIDDKHLSNKKITKVKI